MENNKKDMIDQLKRDLLLWEGFRPPQSGASGSFGLGPLEGAFPNGVFPTGAIHEFVSLCPEDTAACGGLIAGLVQTLLKDGGACLWISYTRRIYPPALKLFGVDPDRIVFVDVPRQKDVLWVTEEALKCEGVAAVIAETGDFSFMESRRLQLAVEQSKVTGFVLRKDAKKIGATACVARWKVTQMPSELGDGMPGVGFPRWRVELLKVRNGNPGVWTIEWSKRKFRPIIPLTHKEKLRRYA
jgi:protein ImuA